MDVFIGRWITRAGKVLVSYNVTIVRRGIANNRETGLLPTYLTISNTNIVYLKAISCCVRDMLMLHYNRKRTSAVYQECHDVMSQYMGISC